MDMEHEFKVNKFITLKLERDETNIYVVDEKFDQCKYLFLLDPNETIAKDINTVDDAVEFFANTLEGEEITPQELGITSEQIFWAHCSNIQTWVEYDYDTRILHSNLSFPLLKRLTQLGDSKANRVFKCEIAKRIELGNIKTFSFLVTEGYLEFLNAEEMETIVEETMIIEKLLNSDYDYIQENLCFYLKKIYEKNKKIYVNRVIKLISEKKYNDAYYTIIIDDELILKMLKLLEEKFFNLLINSFSDYKTSKNDYIGIETFFYDKDYRKKRIAKDFLKKPLKNLIRLITKNKNKKAENLIKYFNLDYYGKPDSILEN